MQYGRTALYRACEEGYLEVVKMLLVRPEIDANIRDQVSERNWQEITLFLLDDFK